MTMHRREGKVAKANLEATRALLDIWQKHDLTWGEIVAFHARELASAGKYIIRTERHPDEPGKPGGEE